MKEIRLYQEDTLSEALNDFIQGIYNAHMDYLASDLLEMNFEPKEIITAINAALRVCRASGLTPREHFYPVMTEAEGVSVKDCKLTKLAYGLVLLNASELNPKTAQFQVKLLKHFFDD